jgi:hypothetical integral membrane protein (TIGR02206 family)
MISDFRVFGAIHLLSLLAAVFIGTGFIIWGSKTCTDDNRRLVRLLLAITIILIRCSRYIMDVCFGVFEWADLLSLHICHIDLILLVICLIKPNKTLFSFCFLIGIPTALSVALFPGTNHPAPGVPRAVLFIMSHTMLVMGALYLSIAERMKPTLRQYGLIGIIGSICLIPVYFVNRIIGTNYLYIMEAPKGTVLTLFEELFGWPGYVIALDVLALLLMLLMLCLGQLIFRAAERVRLKNYTV